MMNLQCKRCGWNWTSRKEELPACCPKCKRYDWNIGEKDKPKRRGLFSR